MPNHPVIYDIDLDIAAIGLRNVAYPPFGRLADEDVCRKIGLTIWSLSVDSIGENRNLFLLRNGPGSIRFGWAGFFRRKLAMRSPE